MGVLYRHLFCTFLLSITISKGKAEQDHLQRILYQEYLQNPSGPYKYGYLTDTNQQSQTRDYDGITRGYYSYLDDQGETQYVQYTAGTDGFKVQGTTVPIHAHKKVTYTPEVEAARKAHEKAYLEIRNRDLEFQRTGKANVLVSTAPTLQTRKSKDFDTNEINFNFYNVAPWLMSQMTNNKPSMGKMNYLETDFDHFDRRTIISAAINTSKKKDRKEERDKDNKFDVVPSRQEEILSIKNKDEHFVKLFRKVSEIMQNSNIGIEISSPTTSFPALNFEPSHDRKISHNSLNLQPVKYKDLEVNIKSVTEHSSQSNQIPNLNPHKEQNVNTKPKFEYISSTLPSSYGDTEPTVQTDNVGDQFLLPSIYTEKLSQEGEETNKNTHLYETTTESKPIFEVLYSQKNQTSIQLARPKNESDRVNTEKTLTSHEVDLINYKKTILDGNKTEAL